MNNPNSFDRDNNQFVVSPELLQLLQWLFENEQPALKKLVAQSLQRGLQLNPQESPAELQQSVVDFFALLDTLLYEVLQEQDVKKIMERHLLPAIDHIDSTACDTATLAMSVEKTTASCQEHPHQNPKEILCKELLKRWKPSKKLSH